MTAAGPSAAEVDRFRTDLIQLTGDRTGRLGVAVSGGPDSLALLLLADSACPGKIEGATVDHQLRTGSTGEAEFVAGLCRQMGIPHAILRADQPIEGNVQSAARKVRYRLLEAWRRERALDWIATAHHADDQAETLLMRLNRSSGVAGLTGIRAVNGRILRPLLGWRRAELAAIVERSGIDPVDDPSNADPRFDRVRIREALAAAEWIDVGAVAASAGALAEAEQALEWAAGQLERDRISGDDSEIRLDPGPLPEELRRRLVLRALRLINPDAEPRGHELSRLLATLAAGGSATLAGVKCSGGGVWRFEPAPPRRSG